VRKEIAMKAKLALVSLLAAGAALPSSAAAAPPEREPVPAEVFIAPAGLYCDFPIQITPLKLREKLTFFSDGRIRVTGSAIVEVTNLDSGRSTVINSSGPSWLDSNSGQGPQLLFLSALEGGPGIFLYHGNVTFARDADGNIVDITATGTRSGNLCAAIA
jgi:hypothetical protein